MAYYPLQCTLPFGQAHCTLSSDTIRFYSVAFGTGLRPSEQYALQWKHVDFERKQLLIRQGFVRGRMTILKTAGSRRDVEMLPTVEQALRGQYAVREGTHVFPMVGVSMVIAAEG